MTLELITFPDAISEAEGRPGSRHLLLGNGFSIACRPDLFTYGRLFDEADFEALSIAADGLFEISGTSDFERAIEALRICGRVLELYPDPDAALLERTEADVEAVRSALADVLAAKHPERPADIEDDEYASARRFLSRFDGRIWTVNYDLLLYWTLLKEGEPEVTSDDGFRADPDDPDTEWVVWDGYEGRIDQRIYFLHGGLHLFDAGSELRKITWVRTGIPLVDQIRDALERNLYPLVVTEGESEEKLARIEHSPYLHKGLKSIQNCGGSVFIHGHSLAENDAHILARIERSKIECAYVSLHGDPESESNRDIRHRAGLMSEHRNANEAGKPENRRRLLELRFYDADSASIWRT